MQLCPACAALRGAPTATSPHAQLLLFSESDINYGATATGRAEYYVCHECGAEWERDVARSEPDTLWKPSPKPLR